MREFIITNLPAFPYHIITLVDMYSACMASLCFTALVLEQETP